MLVEYALCRFCVQFRLSHLFKDLMQVVGV